MAINRGRLLNVFFECAHNGPICKQFEWDTRESP